MEERLTTERKAPGSVGDRAREAAARLACWSGPVVPEPVLGGLTNQNFVVVDRGARFFVRIGHDLPAHGILRFHELAASRAAHAAGVSPEVVHHEPGALVLRFIDGRTLTAADLRAPVMLQRVAALLRRCHDDMVTHFRGPILAFWVFQVIGQYARAVREAQSPHAAALPRLLTAASDLARRVGPVTLALCHNDLLPQNILDDGERLWLVDWDYAGMNTPLFDLAGLASNCELDPEQERALLAHYLAKPPDGDTLSRFHALKCASLLREALWSMASELDPSLDVDYAAYTLLNLERFERAFAGSP